MKNQACEPCAKRKVRCDKGEPCTNCKRRKHDHCTYPDASPFDQVKRLESIVRSLGGDPDQDVRDTGGAAHQTDSTPASGIAGTPQQDKFGTTTLTEVKSKDPVIVEEDGHQLYLESRAWNGWLGNGHVEEGSRDSAVKTSSLPKRRPDALQAIFSSRLSTDLASIHPSENHAIVLWDAFNQRVYPLIKISFTWQIQRIRRSCNQIEDLAALSPIEHAFVFAVYLLGVISLSDEECLQELQHSKTTLVGEYERHCEEALHRINIFCITDILGLKALAMYMIAGFDRLSTHSLWSLMGVVLRNAERLGMHRDGALLGLSPIDAEERRRLWWQLQHMDLFLAVRSGSTSLTMMADWDVKLPLNIEDDDITTEMTTLPDARKGLTSMSYCLYTYWVIELQRSFFRQGNGQFALSWQTNESISLNSKDSLITQLEDGLNRTFLQYCDPIKPVETLIQFSARSLICGFRLRTLHPLVFGRGSSSKPPTDEQREALSVACSQSLEYEITLRGQKSVQHFRWLTKAWFPWHAFMCTLVDVSRLQTQNYMSKSAELWELLARLYDANRTLSDLSDDRRKAHAARLIVAAWQARQIKNSTECGVSFPTTSTPTSVGPKQRIPNKPIFVMHLEDQLHLLDGDVGKNTQQNSQPGKTGGRESSRASDPTKATIPSTPESISADPSAMDSTAVANVFDLDFEDIDWAFWSSVD